MIIWGCRTKKIGQRKVDMCCPICGEFALEFTGYVRVFDIYFIPVFPFKKMYEVLCLNCSSAFSKELIQDIVSPDDLKFKTPWWAFSLILLFAIIWIWVISLPFI